MRRLLALVSAIIFVDALLFTALTPLVPAYAEEFDLSKAGAGLLVGAYGAGALFGGIPGGLAAARFGPKRAVVGGLLLLAVASFAFASADSAVALGAARFVQGIASTATWAGALAWISVDGAARAARRGDRHGVRRRDLRRDPRPGLRRARRARRHRPVLRASSAWSRSRSQGSQGSHDRRRRETLALAGLAPAFRDQRFVGGLWLNMLPAMLFGLLIVLTPLALDEAGWSTFAIAAVFFAARPRRRSSSIRCSAASPIARAGCCRSAPRSASSAVVAVALAASSRSGRRSRCSSCAASLSFGSLYTPGMSLTSIGPRRPDSHRDSPSES